MTVVAYLTAIFKFAFRMNPLLYLSTAISLFSVLIELAAIALMPALASMAVGQPLLTNSGLLRFLIKLGIPLDAHSLIFLFLGLLGARVTTELVGSALTIRFGRLLLAQLVSQGFMAMVRDVPLRDIERTSVGNYISVLGDESFRASNIVIFLNQFVSVAFLGVLYFVAIYLYSPAVALGVVVFLSISFLSLLESFRASQRLGERQVEQSKSHNSLFIDALNGIRTVRALSAEDYVASRYRQQIFDYARTLFWIDFISGLTRMGPVLVLLVGIGLVVGFGTVSSTVWPSLPFMVTVTVLLMRFFPVLGQAVSMALRLLADLRAGKDVTQLISTYPPAEQLVDSSNNFEQINKIEIVSLGFAHEPGKPTIEGVSLELERGKSYAMIGASGSGKSTLLDLLLGLHQSESGRILVNDQPLPAHYVSMLRRKVVLASQEPTIFNDTVVNNVRFGLQASRQDVERACRIACIHDFIVGLPQGYDTWLSYRGSNLSGGQRQRIGIARAILRCPDVLLLDESTSALDADTREQLVRNLQWEFAERILLFVTHDAFVVSRANEVFDMAAINRAWPQQVGSETESGAN